MGRIIYWPEVRGRMIMNRLMLDAKIREWLLEDMNNGDITSDSLLTDNEISSGIFIAKEAGILAGLEVVERVFAILDDNIDIKFFFKDGDHVAKGDQIARIQGETRNILKGERLALNLLQRLSGIATQTAMFVEQVNGMPVRIADTRKTTPGLRFLEKYAVTVGGGYNHRFNLSESVMLKDNHIAACGSIGEAVRRVRSAVSHTIRIEVEVESLEQLAEALEAKADIIMLDNMSVAMMKEAVQIAGGRALLEASGNVTLQNVRSIAETGVDVISVGSITHSVKALDISLRFNI